MRNRYRVRFGDRAPATEAERLTQLFHEIGVDHSRRRVDADIEHVEIAGTLFVFRNGRLVLVDGACE